LQVSASARSRPGNLPPGTGAPCGRPSFPQHATNPGRLSPRERRSHDGKTSRFATDRLLMRPHGSDHATRAGEASIRTATGVRCQDESSWSTTSQNSMTGHPRRFGGPATRWLASSIHPLP
jgi:hypothetical protein